jgi:16S rRNA (cytidine1402-2'-O)-methyltransferase
MTTGKLYLIPCTLASPDAPSLQIDTVLPLHVKNIIEKTDYFIVENAKTARKFIKHITPNKEQQKLTLFTLNKRTQEEDYKEMIAPLLEGKNVGVISEAGCPAIADPGAVVVKLCHQKNISVIPLVGPSSIFLALMSSGLSGQNFAFNGYLPIDKSERKTALKNLEKWSYDKEQAQIFMETPYRNNKFLEDILQILHPKTYLCVACDITLETEFIKTQSVEKWRKTNIDIQNRPCIYIIQQF